MVRIEHIEDTISKLQQLTSEATPAWGSMTPQQMVEHLVATIQFTNGKQQMSQRTTKEEAEAFKTQWIYTDMEFPMGIKTPMIVDGPPVYVYQDIPAAVVALKTELADLESYFTHSPGVTPTHPRLGPLNYQEWLIFHGKHFTHHFKQFSLI